MAGKSLQTIITQKEQNEMKVGMLNYRIAVWRGQFNKSGAEYDHPNLHVKMTKNDRYLALIVLSGNADALSRAMQSLEDKLTAGEGGRSVEE